MQAPRKHANIGVVLYNFTRGGSFILRVRGFHLTALQKIMRRLCAGVFHSMKMDASDRKIIPLRAMSGQETAATWRMVPISGV